LWAGISDAGSPLHYFVGTVPPCRDRRRHGRGCLCFRERFADAAAWSEVRRAWGKLLRKKYGAVWAFEATHPVGDPEDPRHKAASGWNPAVPRAVDFHPHVNFLWYSPGRSRWNLDLAELRRDWATVLGLAPDWVQLDLTSAGEARRARDWKPRVVVWHGYGFKDPREGQRDAGKFVHYVVRPFPGFRKWTGNVRWYGKYPRAVEPEPAAPCEHCGEPIRMVASGFWAETLIKRWVEAGALEGVPIRGRPPPWADG
jgi:hypothetical protein